MKENVSVEQLRALSFDEQKKIATLFGQYGNCIRNNNNGTEYFNLGILSERINITKMIAVLDKILISINRRDVYIVLFSIDFKEYEFRNEELCDALWECIKIASKI